jgi:hypothetical protein
MMEETCSSETSVLAIVTRLNIPEDGILGIIYKFRPVMQNKTCGILEVFTAVTMKNGVFWDVMPCGSCKHRHIGGT